MVYADTRRAHWCASAHRRSSSSRTAARARRWPRRCWSRADGAGARRRRARGRRGSLLLSLLIGDRALKLALRARRVLRHLRDAQHTAAQAHRAAADAASSRASRGCAFALRRWSAASLLPLLLALARRRRSARSRLALACAALLLCRWPASCSSATCSSRPQLGPEMPGASAVSRRDRAPAARARLTRCQRDGPLTRELLRTPGRLRPRAGARRGSRPTRRPRMVCGFCSTGCGLTVHLQGRRGGQPDAGRATTR